jgi:hypothetical protein
VGAGHLISGQRGRGHGGQSPEGFLHLLQSRTTGCGLGMEDRKTYLLKSGTGGHSVLSMYLLRSGMGGHGGTVDFKTYLLRSGSGHDGHGGQRGRGLGHPHGFERPQLLQDASWNPSLDKNERLMIIPIKIPNKRVRPGITIFDIVAMVSSYYYL